MSVSDPVNVNQTRLGSVVFSNGKLIQQLLTPGSPGEAPTEIKQLYAPKQGKRWQLTVIFPANCTGADLHIHRRVSVEKSNGETVFENILEESVETLTGSVIRYVEIWGQYIGFHIDNITETAPGDLVDPFRIYMRPVG